MRFPSIRSGWLCCLAWGLVVLPGVVQASEQHSPLLSLVGEEAELAIEVAGLGPRLPALRESEFLRRFGESSFYRAWQESEESQKLARIGRVLERVTGLSIDDLAVDLFGKSVLVVFVPGEDGDTEHIILTQASSPQALADMVASWTEKGRAAIDSVAHAGGNYFRRTRTSGEGETARQHVLYYAVLEDVFAISEHEDLVRRAVELHAKAKGAAPSLGESAAFTQARAALAPNTLVTVYYRPRVDHGPEAVGGVARTLLAPFQHRAASAALGLRLDEGPIVESVVHWRDGKPPESLAPLASAAPETPRFLERVPRSSVGFIAGGGRPEPLASFLFQRLLAADPLRWQNTREAARGLLLGLDPLDDVLAGMGQNWGAYVLPRNASGDGRLPLDALLAIEMPDNADPQAAKIRAALNNGTSTCLHLLAAIANAANPAETAVVRTEGDAEELLRWIENYGSYELSFAVSQEYFLVATSPELIRQFRETDADASILSAPEFEELRTRYFQNENHVLYVDVAKLRRMLAERREDFINYGVKAKRLAAERAQQQLDDFARVLKLLDTVFIAGHVEASRTKLILGGTAKTLSSTASAP